MGSKRTGSRWRRHEATQLGTATASRRDTARLGIRAIIRIKTTLSPVSPTSPVKNKNTQPVTRAKKAEVSPVSPACLPTRTYMGHCKNVLHTYTRFTGDTGDTGDNKIKSRASDVTGSVTGSAVPVTEQKPGGRIGLKTRQDRLTTTWRSALSNVGCRLDVAHPGATAAPLPQVVNMTRIPSTSPPTWWVKNKVVNTRHSRVCSVFTTSPPHLVKTVTIAFITTSWGAVLKSTHFL